MPHLPRGQVRANEPTHVTLRVRAVVPNLRSVRFVRAFEDSLRRLRRDDFRVVHYSIQSNHAHFVIEADGGRSLARGMMALATRFALAVRRALRHAGRVLADRYHVHRLRTPREVRNAIAYVLLNARKHLAERVGRTAARRVGIARPDPASSGRWFDGWAAVVTMPKDERAAPVVPPRTWLLREGWRRHGRIDVEEVPGPAKGRAAQAEA